MNPNDTGENLETPPASPAEITTTEPTDTENPQGAVVTESPEEVAFNSLKGGTQDRIKALIRERDLAKEEAERARNYFTQQPQGFTQPPIQPDLSNPQVRTAVDQLSKVGIATDEKVNSIVNERIGNLIYNFELSKLEDKLDGTNGLPKFDRSEYQDFIQRNPKYQGYDPEDVYNKMYEEEIMDARMKVRSGQPQQPTSSLRPNKTTVREEQWTPESVEARMRETDGKEWYTKNISLVNKVLSTQTPQQ